MYTDIRSACCLNHAILQLKAMSLHQLVNEAARIIYAVNDPTKDKTFELEMSWVGAETSGKFQRVPADILKAAEDAAKAALADDSDDDE